MSPVSTVTTWPQPRALREDEWPALRAAVNEVFRPGGGDLFQESPLLFDGGNRENLRVIVSGDRTGAGTERGQPAPDGAADAPTAPTILSHAGFVTRDALVLRRRVRISCVGAVFTAASWRGKGLGSRVLTDALQRARRGADLVMASGDRGLYRRQGLDSVPPLARFTMPPRTAPAPGLEVRPATEADLEAMAALYDAEDVHFIRSAADWGHFWKAGVLVDAPAVFSTVLRAGVVVAYVAAQPGGARPNGSRRPRRILELAGDRGAIVEAAPLLAEELLVPVYDSKSISACESKGWTRTARQFLITAEALTAEVRVIPWYGLNYL